MLLCGVIDAAMNGSLLMQGYLAVSRNGYSHAGESGGWIQQLASTKSLSQLSLPGASLVLNAPEDYLY